MLKVEGNLISEDLEKAEALANQFQSVFTREDTVIAPWPSTQPFSWYASHPGWRWRWKEATT